MGMENLAQNHQKQPLLLVDDDIAYSRALSRSLSKNGFSVWSANTLDEAFETARSIPFKFAIIDLHLDKDDGLDLVRHFTEAYPETKTVVVSGYVTPSLAAHAVRCGAFDCLSKPSDLNILLHALTKPSGGGEVLGDGAMTEPSQIRVSYLLARWEKNNRNSSKTARQLGMHRRTLQRILRREGIEGPDEDKCETHSKFGELRRVFSIWKKFLPA